MKGKLDFGRQQSSELKNGYKAELASGQILLKQEKPGWWKFDFHDTGNDQVQLVLL